MVLNQPQGGFRTPTPYDKELSSIARRERMAQIMQQQALQPLEINSFQGFQAPISPLQGLAKALQMYAGMTASDKADESRAGIGKRMQTDAAQQIASLEGTPAQPAIAPTPGTSFTPMGADFEDNPNLPIAASGNVEIAGTPGRAAIPAMPLGEAEKKQRLIQILTGGNPYSAPAAKFMLEDMQKAPSTIKEYEYARDKQGFQGTLQDFRMSMRPPGTTVNMPTSMQPMWVRNKETNQMEWVQPNNRGTFDLSKYEQAGTTEIEKLIGARDRLPQGSADRNVLQGMIDKLATQSFAPNATVVSPTGTTQATPAPLPNTTNVMVDGVLTAMPIAQAEELNAKFRGAETSAVEGAKAQFDFVTVPDPKNPAQKILIPKSRVAELSAAGTPLVAEVDKKVAQGISVLELAEKAKDLLPQASSGALSTLATIAADAAGYATNKSKADGALNVISAGLTSNVPRFEGPQGVLDVQLYKQAAADVGNSLIPYQKRLAALNAVIELNKKYAPVGAPPPNSVRRIK